jgi:hypothetical protein
VILCPVCSTSPGLGHFLDDEASCPCGRLSVSRRKSAVNDAACLRVSPPGIGGRSIALTWSGSLFTYAANGHPHRLIDLGHSNATGVVEDFLDHLDRATVRSVLRS